MVEKRDMAPVLVTGASGRTGRRVVKALAARGASVRVFIRRENAELRSLGATEIAIGDLLDRGSLAAAMHGAGQVLHICPPMHPQEDAIARDMIEIATRANGGRFVLYSVLHPLLADVPHHARKLAAERALVDSGLDYTILQPGRYMQQLLPIWKNVLATGVHDMPFATTARFSVVDLDDLAEAAARVVTEPGHQGATYQLAGPEHLSQDDMAEILSELLGRPIRAARKPPQDMRREAAAAGMPAERIETMVRMNAHYDGHGLIGNANVLRWLIGRPPTTFRDFVRRELLDSAPGATAR
jgi:uncharacterized protein YbjT (DUF2867 family)